MSCPRCAAQRYQVRDGKTTAGSQRIRCRICGKRYTPVPKQHGYSRDMRTSALRMVTDGLNLRRAARRLPIQHPTMVSWKRQAAKRLPATPPQPQLVQQVELDEMSTVVGDNNNGTTS